MDIWMMTTEMTPKVGFNVAPSLRGRDYKDPPLILEDCEEMSKEHIYLESHPNDSRIGIEESGASQTLSSRMGTGGG